VSEGHLRRGQTRRRALLLGAAGLLAACVGGCGGSAKDAAPPLPTFPRPVAATLAAQSDAVADALVAGHACRALTLARRLQRTAITAINALHVDARLQEDLQSAVNDLAARVACSPPPASQPQDEEHDRGKGHGKKKHEGHD
jgi:hypothetical protein